MHTCLLFLGLCHRPKTVLGPLVDDLVLLLFSSHQKYESKQIHAKPSILLYTNQKGFYDTRSPKGRCQKKKTGFYGNFPPSLSTGIWVNNRFLESTASLKRDCVNVYIVCKHGLPRERRMLIQAGAEYHEAPHRHRGCSKMNNDFYV